MDKEGVLVVGSANIDMVVTTDRFPYPGETIFGKKFQTYSGGKGANQAVGCAKLGIKTYFIGKFGNDDFGVTLAKNMRKDGVNLDHIFIDNDESTGTALITVNNEGQNEIIVISGSNMKLYPSDIEKKISLFEQVRVVLSQFEIPIETVAKAAEICKRAGSLFILNPAPGRKIPDELLEQIDFLTPNEIELELISGMQINDEESICNASKVLLKRGVKNVIVTMGSIGSLWVNKNKCLKFPAIKVQAVDTTGAGDAFNGALAFSLAYGNSPEKSIEFANKVASISVTRMGAQSSLPYYSEIELTLNSEEK
jgi:ribokinase